jgi:hypothetical protein
MNVRGKLQKSKTDVWKYSIKYWDIIDLIRVMVTTYLMENIVRNQREM